jgi:hypothetical protein
MKMNSVRPGWQSNELQIRVHDSERILPEQAGPARGAGRVSEIHGCRSDTIRRGSKSGASGARCKKDRDDSGRAQCSRHE